MEGINKKYNLEIEVLSPISIGTGSEKDLVRGVDFVVDSGTLYKINLKKILEHGVGIEDVTNFFVYKNENGLKSKLAGLLDKVSDYSMPFPADSDNDVKTFLKNQLNGKPVLAGSSIKGAIRSVLFQYLEGRTKDGREVFGTSKDGDEFMRFIKVSDAEFEGTSLVNTKIFNLRSSQNKWLGGWKYDFNSTRKEFSNTGFNTLYESLMPSQKGYASLMISEKLYDSFENTIKAHIKSERKRPVVHNGTEKLFALINDHTKDYLEKERSFFQRYATDKTRNIIESIDELLKQIPSDNSYCILKMSAGSGFHSITGDWQFKEDYCEGRFDRKRARREELNTAGRVLPKSRKIAVWDDHFSLMGFVKLRTISAEELENIKTENLKRLEAEKQARKQVELQRIQEETQEKERKQRILDDFNNCVSKGESNMIAGLYENALESYLEAKRLIPDRVDLDRIIDDLKTKVDSINRERQLSALHQQDEEQRRQANAVPLVEKMAKANKLPTLYGNVKQWMKQNGLDALTNDDRGELFEQIKRVVTQMKEGERKKMKNLGKELPALVGEDTADKWFEQIFQVGNS